ncbi:hypothetical protein [Candidatus Enterococcus mansonii]|uniref:ABC transporter permease n=1 Tax=Candidatus Enterococcus mansonii TaxID=1834181 RepID=A0A242CEK7_9ENTE|nr:hypothetical protein [Enterococcus sp. 4G2_DIV0659]OTO08675.1 hypothetical protein A5880_001675 [Enterococcus sp. 4G2_DIV0659]
MINMLKADIYRIVKSSLCLYSLVGLLLLGVFFSFMGSSSSAMEMVQGGLSNGSILLPVFLTNIYMVSWGHEFSYRTVNNSLIGGIKRSTFFLSKTFLTFILTVLFLSVYAIGLVGTALVLKGGFAIVPILKALAAQTLLYLTVSSIGILLFNVIQASYVSVAAFISVAFIGDNILSSIISTYFPKADFILDTLFFTNIRSLSDVSTIPSKVLSTMLISSIVYGVIALFVSYSVFSNREFK